MGRKISVDSATMMNKGLEVIEAHWLFDLPGSRIEVLIHPQSVIHSMVSYADGSVLAQLGNPDMRTPIAHALAFPDRVDSGVAPLDLAQIASLTFEKPDFERFPCLALAFKALDAGGTASAALNAANEVAVEAFLARRIGFMAIGEVVERVLDALPNGRRRARRRARRRRRRASRRAGFARQPGGARPRAHRALRRHELPDRNRRLRRRYRRAGRRPRVWPLQRRAMCGVKVLRFSVGFGKPLGRWVSEKTGVEWTISALPLGGYVKMLDEREAESAIPAEDLPRAFNRQVGPEGASRSWPRARSPTSFSRSCCSRRCSPAA